MDVALLIAFLLSNACWLIYTYNREKNNMIERNTLQNRIANPRMIVNPLDSEGDQEIPTEPMDAIEYASVGQIGNWSREDDEG